MPGGSFGTAVGAAAARLLRPQMSTPIPSKVSVLPGVLSSCGGGEIVLGPRRDHGGFLFLATGITKHHLGAIKVQVTFQKKNVLREIFKARKAISETRKHKKTSKNKIFRDFVCLTIFPSVKTFFSA